MAVRSDFTIDWNVSPRVIIVGAPSVECTMQDLLDTLRWEESQEKAMVYTPIVSASGKEPIGGGTLVGITVSLLNAVIGFEARSGPDWTVCDLSGGNLVAFDTDGVTTIQSLYPTAYVSIGKTSSSSATLQEQDALNYASYGGMVSVDVLSSQSGSVYPSGNQEYPVNNFADAEIIAYEKGFRELGIRESCTMDGTVNFEGFKITGHSHVATVVTVEAASTLDYSVLTQLTLIGDLDSNTDVNNCIVRDLTYFNGHIHDSSIGGEITLDGSAESFISHCSRLESETMPGINFNDGDNHLVMPNYTGMIKFTNMTVSTVSALIGLDKGAVILDSATVTAGTITITGFGYLQDELGNEITTGEWNGVAIINTLISNESISASIWEDNSAPINIDGKAAMLARIESETQSP